MRKNKMPFQSFNAQPLVTTSYVVLTPRSVHLDEPLSRGLARRRLRLMLKIRVGQNMDFRGFSGGNTKGQAVAECPEEGEEGTHGNTAKLVMGWHEGGRTGFGQRVGANRHV